MAHTLNFNPPISYNSAHRGIHFAIVEYKMGNVSILKADFSIELKNTLIVPRMKKDKALEYCSQFPDGRFPNSMEEVAQVLRKFLKYGF